MKPFQTHNKFYMKNRIFLVIAAFLFAAAVQAQSTVDSIAAKYKLVPMPEPLTVEKTFPVLGTYQLGNTDAFAPSASVTTTTNNASNSSAVTTAPSAETTTTSPAAGTEMASPGSVTITLDPENKGLVWVEGLPQGKFKAYLRKSPSTYRILSQKTESGEQVPEGTLMYDPETKMLNIALGKAYDDADPAAIFALNPALSGNAATTEPAPADNTVKIKTKTATSKTKAKVTYYTASKIEQTPTATTTTSDATTAPAAPQQQPAPAQQPQQPAPAPAPQQ
jgi:hypothetical protein